MKKNNPETYKFVVVKLMKKNVEKTIIFEDNIKNIKLAKSLGFKTAFVTDEIMEQKFTPIIVIL